MAVPILLPKQGNTVETCLILEWKKRKGEEIKKGEVVCDIETDKAVFELESPADGIILDIFFNEGEDVPVLTNLAVVGTKGENYDEYLPEIKKTNIENKKDNIKSNLNSGPAAVDKSKSIDSLVKDTSSDNKRISPRAKILAEKFKLPIDKIKGTGPDSRIIERDIISESKNYEFLTNAASDLISDTNLRPKAGSGIGNRITTKDIQEETQTPIYNLEEESIKVVPLRGIRKLIAERMLESLKNSAQLTLNSSANATALLNLRKRFKNSKLYQEFQSVTINDLIHYAVIKTLPGHLEMNSLLVGDKIEYYNRIHLGFAVDTPRGLMVPVIKNSQDLNLIQLSREAKHLAAASLSGKIDTEELKGATFTVTNLGSFGIEGENGIEFIPHISFSLTVDHRAIDGAVGARFLQSLAKTISEIDLAITSDTMRK